MFAGTAGLAASAALFGACGGSDSASASPAAQPFTVLPRFPNGQRMTPGSVRLAWSIADDNAATMTTGPEVLTGTIVDGDGATVAQVSAPRRGTGLSVPYWSVTADLPSAGLYELRLDGSTGSQAFMLHQASEISIPTVGAPLPPFDTPTTANARGVDPVCTRLDGACPFHEVSLTEALALGKPVVYMVGTPAHCEFATCGPGLEFLIDESKQYAAAATFVHAEVYADPAATEVAPAVTALTLDYEPLIWVTDAAGMVVERIDIVWDAKELSAILASVLG